MRPLLALVLACAPALAGPYVRWMNAQGEPRTAPIAGVERESAARIEARLASGERVSIEGRFLLGLQREDARDEDQRALLEARRDVARRRGLEAARPVLDRLAAVEDPAWVGRHAQAWRAILAVDAGEKGAAERVAAYLEAHPESRLACDVLVARARLRSHGYDNIDAVHEEAVKTLERIAELGGPMVVQWQVVPDAWDRALHLEDDIRIYGGLVDGLLERSEEQAPDYASWLAIQDARLRLAVKRERRRRLLLAADGLKPFRSVLELRRLRDPNLLPETRSLVEHEIGLACIDCGEVEQAREALEKALADAQDEASASEIKVALSGLRKAG